MIGKCTSEVDAILLRTSPNLSISSTVLERTCPTRTMPPDSSTPSDSVTERALRVFLFSQGEDIVLGHSVARLCGKQLSIRLVFQRMNNA